MKDKSLPATQIPNTSTPIITSSQGLDYMGYCVRLHQYEMHRWSRAIRLEIREQSEFEDMDYEGRA